MPQHCAVLVAIQTVAVAAAWWPHRTEPELNSGLAAARRSHAFTPLKNTGSSGCNGGEAEKWPGPGPAGDGLLKDWLSPAGRSLPLVLVAHALDRPLT